MNDFVVLRTNKEFKNKLKHGYLWIFSNELEPKTKSKHIAAVSVYDHKGNFLCKGVYNPHSLIAVRVLSLNKEEKIDKEYFRKRILKALQYREKHGFNIHCCRLVYGESDLLPGVVIDRYNDIFVLQFYSYAMEMLFKNLIIETIVEIFNPSQIVIRNDFYQRKLENATEYKEVVYSRDGSNSTIINHCGIKFVVDIFNGQKTGFYYDQYDNRRYITSIVNNKKVLDLCCYTGSFGIISVLNGAKYVVGVDSSEFAVELAKENAKINNVKVEFINCKVETFINSCKEKYDVIIFDPPSYVKSNKDLANGIKKYEVLCSKIINMLEKDGIFCFSVCARHVDLQTTQKIILSSLLKNKRKGFILYYGKQSNDHPVYLPMKEETEYLKFVTIQITC